MLGATLHVIVNIGHKAEDWPRQPALHLHCNREKWGVFDSDSAFFNWRDEEIPIPFALEQRRKELDQSGPADRRLLVEPGAVSRDTHVDFAAIRWIPQVHRRGTLGACGVANDRRQIALP